MRGFWRNSVTEDIEHIAANLREMDIVECWEMGGPKGIQVILTEALHRSRPCHTGVLEDGTPVCMMGVIPFTAGAGVVWLLGTDLLFAHARRHFIAATKMWCDLRNEEYPVLFNYINPDNHLTIRWLKWAGFEFPPGSTIPTLGKDYQLFQRIRNV